MQSFVSGSSHWAHCLQPSSMLQHVSEFPSFSEIFILVLQYWGLIPRSHTC
jgi:hypothetical protein